ncbi:MAG TPA: hypothetical protein VFK20_11605 [Vicinamibacterales bacterium]|nr:hypothetical protein [Vicinamibacterales bacterium]
MLTKTLRLVVLALPLGGLLLLVAALSPAGEVTELAAFWLLLVWLCDSALAARRHLKAR